MDRQAAPRLQPSALAAALGSHVCPPTSPAHPPPLQWDKQGFLSELKGGAALKHVETDDRSAPKIEEDVHLKPSPHNALLQELKSKTPTQE